MWNEHKLQVKGERRRTPRDLFFSSLLQDGPRGLELDTAGHAACEGESSTALEGLFLPERQNFSQVNVEVPGCPLRDDELQEVDRWLQTQVDPNIRCMLYRKSVWVDGLDLCSRLHGN